MNILITGGSGFIGTNLILSLLCENSVKILNIDIAPPRNSDLTNTWVQCDILDLNKLTKEFKKFSPQYVIHLAARADLHGLELRDYKTNTIGLQNIVHCCNTSLTLRRVIFTSTMLVNRLGKIPRDDLDFEPNTIYGMSKAEGEIIIRKNIREKLEWVIIRPTSIWGPWFQSPYKKFFEI